MTVNQAVKNNKMISIIIGTVATGLLMWGVWVTDASYKVHYVRTVITEKRDIQIKNICSDIDALKIVDHYIMQDLKEQREKTNYNQEKMYIMLLDIGKEIKKR